MDDAWESINSLDMSIVGEILEMDAGLDCETPCGRIRKMGRIAIVSRKEHAAEEEATVQLKAELTAKTKEVEDLKAQVLALEEEMARVAAENWLEGLKHGSKGW